jgi:hypothetical protein
MTASRERQLARLRARLTRRTEDLAELGFLMKGTLLQRFKRCSSPGCGCQSDPAKLHGPYWQWTNKVGGKTVTRALDANQARRYQEWMENTKRFEAIVQELHRISEEADHILREQEREAGQRDRAMGKRQARSRS